MKKLVYAVLPCSLLLAAPARACDICGCGVSNYNPYLFPHLSKSYIGLSYISRSYRTFPIDDAPSRETYRSILLSGQYRVGKKLQLLALLPWQQNMLRSESGNRTLSGLGDITLLAQYKVWDHSTEKVRHTVLAGAGLKLATGRFTPAGTNKAADQNFQLGTGSTDYIVNGSYRISTGKWLFGAGGSYKYNTSNADGFRYGDVLNLSLLAAWRYEWANWSLLPYLQLSHEALSRDADHNVLQRHSGGTVAYAGGGIDLSTRAITLGLNYQFAAGQHLADGQISAEPKFSAHASFSF
ncbi:transporter [Flaviaesturariibacter flavus]|uniref:Transporter n=1 Tax=Flaviaesturariibacter flavus TaxID=2502780 RepID=A0A4R1BQS1_9BACT|nr:transporter [Flaviaesturariibacter flavus]TCJ19626.1 transporter [Flaviaesturariibacter flavus]